MTTGVTATERNSSDFALWIWTCSVYACMNLFCYIQISHSRATFCAFYPHEHVVQCLPKRKYHSKSTLSPFICCIYNLHITRPFNICNVCYPASSAVRLPLGTHAFEYILTGLDPATLGNDCHSPAKHKDFISFSAIVFLKTLIQEGKRLSITYCLKSTNDFFFYI